MMEFPGSIEQAKLLASASTAEVYAWGASHVLKLFKERTPWHANEVAASRAAHKAQLPVPQVLDGLVEVSEREGIIFERVDGRTMTEYIEDHPDRVEDCAHQAAELHAQIHSTEVTDLPPLVEILTWSIQQANPFEDRTRKAVLDVLHQLPDEGVLCHNDYYPNNIIMSSQGPVVIDWALGTRGSSLADLARTWLLSKMWLEGLEEMKTLQHTWHQFWESYFHRYAALRSINAQYLARWRIVVTTASLTWDRSVTSTDQRVSFVNAALGDMEHPWLRQ